MTGPIDNETSADREIVVSRLIEGPPQVVFEVFSDVSHLGRWWGPHGFSITTHVFEFSVGGQWQFVMHGPDGTDYPNWIEFLEIVPAERIALRHGGGPDDPETFISIITFAGSANGTEVTLRSVFPTKTQRDRAVEQYSAIEGGNETLASLAEYVARLRSGDLDQRSD